MMFKNKISILSLLGLSFMSQDLLAQEIVTPVRAAQETSDKGFSVWDIQGLYGAWFHEPGVFQDVAKGTATLENSSGWSWGSSYFFVDYLRSDSADRRAAEFYGEWYPSISLGSILGRKPALSVMKNVLITTGFNAGSKDTGAAPFVFLPGLTFELKLPLFQFFSIGTYAYVDKGRINGLDNGCNATTYQITPSWSLPLKVGQMHFRFDGFVDFIGQHGQCASQIVAQPTVKLDIGTFLGKPDKLFAGVEWAYWKNKYGIDGLNQTAPQGVLMLVFK